ENVADQLRRRMPFRRVLKNTLRTSMDAGAKGIKILVSGRLGGAEIARSEVQVEGSIPLSTLRADIDYGLAEARTTYGVIGVKVWIYRGEVLDKGKARKNVANAKEG
ncbi:MAG: 30S ribosomal protein S3, partial [Planctomycetota bacterium]